MVVVTGGGSGIGAAAVERFVAEGASVVVADIDVEAAHKVAAMAADSGATAIAQSFDQSDPASIELLAVAVKELGGADVLCVNAAVATPTLAIDSVDADTWDRVHDVNLRGAFLTAQRFVPLLKPVDPAIVFTASIAALRAHPGRLSYAASKGGLVALSRSLAVELAPQRIRVNTVCPGATRTPLAAAVSDIDHELSMKRQSARIPLGRVAEPVDVAAAIAFLASGDARHITGIDLVVDGGKSIAL